MNPLKISDHAVLRWIERVYGVDLEVVRKDIEVLLSPLRFPDYKDFNYYKDGLKVVVVDRKVITVSREAERNANRTKGKKYKNKDKKVRDLQENIY